MTRKANDLLSDQEIRQAFRRRRLRWDDVDSLTLVVEEMAAWRCRVDIAVIGERFLRGYEIKSDLDNLHRLTAQVRDYDRVFDLATLIVTQKHFCNDTIYNVLPLRWGIIRADIGPRTRVRFTSLRAPTMNPHPDHRVPALGPFRGLWSGGSTHSTRVMARRLVMNVSAIWRRFWRR